MVPVYNGTKYLAETLDSVVAQGFDESEMQIEVIDDCSTHDDAEVLVRTRYDNRVLFYRQPQRVGMAGNWNTCIQRAKGSLIHILHQDDFVASGYYEEIKNLADNYPDVGLYSTRTFSVDEQSIIMGMTRRIGELEQPAKAVEPFFYQTPIQCAGVTVRRTSYEALGGFSPDLGYVTDCEMWARITSAHRAVVSPKVLASYRQCDGTETHRVSRTAEGIKAICRLNDIFAQRYAGFSVERGRARVAAAAWEGYLRFKLSGDHAAAAANWEMWVQLTPPQQRLAQYLGMYVQRAHRLGVLGTASRIAAKLSWQSSLK